MEDGGSKMKDQTSRLPSWKIEARTCITAILVIIPAASVFLAIIQLRSELEAANRFVLVVGPILDARTDERICPVHMLPLGEDVVPIEYGLIIPHENESHARRERFPFANSTIDGGCSVNEARRARVLFCPKCREAKRQWMSSR